MLLVLSTFLAIVPTILGLSISTSSSISSTVRCTTSFGTVSSPSVPTKTSTHQGIALPVLATSTSTPIKTVTPATVTSTILQTATSTTTVTDMAITDVFYTTSTIVLTSSSTSVVPVTELDIEETFATTTVTTTIPTSSGFLPAADTTASGSAKMLRQKRRPAKAGTSSNSKALLKGAAAQYPKSVTCIDTIFTKLYYVFVFTAPTHTTTIAAPTKLVTSTVTIYSTSTVVPPDVSSTLSFSTTSTYTTLLISLSTTTSTTTTTIVATSTISSYAACGTSNQYGPNASSGQIDHIGPETGNGYYAMTTATSAYDCCAQCFELDGCSGSYYSTGTAGSAGWAAGTCALLGGAGTTCVNQNSNTYGYLSSSTPDIGPFIVSNSNCGYNYDAGSDASYA